MLEPKQAAIPVPGPEPKPAVGKNSLVLGTTASFSCVSTVFHSEIFLLKGHERNVFSITKTGTFIRSTEYYKEHCA